MAFKALLRQVLQSYCLITSQLQLSLVMFFVRLRVDNDFYLLISRLERQFGLRGVVLEWFRSYLSGRTFRVVFSSNTSSIIYIVCTVPQGSVLGPPAVVHCLHSRPCSYSGEERRISTRVCRRHAAVSTLSSHRHGVSCCTAGTVHHRCRLSSNACRNTSCQPPQAQRGQN